MYGMHYHALDDDGPSAPPMETVQELEAEAARVATELEVALASQSLADVGRLRRKQVSLVEQIKEAKKARDDALKKQHKEAAMAAEKRRKEDEARKKEDLRLEQERQYMKSEAGLCERLATIEETLRLNQQQEDAIYKENGGSTADDSEIGALYSERRYLEKQRSELQPKLALVVQLREEAERRQQKERESLLARESRKRTMSGIVKLCGRVLLVCSAFGVTFGVVFGCLGAYLTNSAIANATAVEDGICAHYTRHNCPEGFAFVPFQGWVTVCVVAASLYCIVLLLVVSARGQFGEFEDSGKVSFPCSRAVVAAIPNLDPEDAPEKPKPPSLLYFLTLPAAVLFIGGIALARHCVEKPCMTLSDYNVADKLVSELCISVGLDASSAPNVCMEKACEEARGLLYAPAVLSLIGGLIGIPLILDMLGILLAIACVFALCMYRVAENSGENRDCVLTLFGVGCLIAVPVLILVFDGDDDD